MGDDARSNASHSGNRAFTTTKDGTVDGITYQLGFRGSASATLARAVDGCVVTRCEGMTTLKCTLPDQAAMFGLIDRVRGLGLELLELQRLGQAPSSPKSQ